MRTCGLNQRGKANLVIPQLDSECIGKEEQCLVLRVVDLRFSDVDGHTTKGSEFPYHVFVRSRFMYRYWTDTRTSRRAFMPDT
jgi:hypothetical protein